ncbi:MAG: DUF1592 domain-containing protein [Myxococcales bacterium]|nr:DUF1592 domain-containing protein [Myxococcales bacterium]
MKRLGRLESIATAVLLFAACTGSPGGGDEGDGDEDGPGGQGGSGGTNGGGSGNGPPEPLPTPPAANSLERNPIEPLSCNKSLFEDPESSPLERLTREQYLNTMRDLFAGLVDAGSLPKKTDIPDPPREGSFSNNVFAQLGSESETNAWEAAAFKISTEAVKDLPKLMGCNPDGNTGCVDTFIDDFGMRAWRRPLSGGEKDALKGLYQEARASLDVKGSVATVLGAMLSSPQFLFRVQEGAGDVEEGQKKRLSGYEMASRLSYFLWNSMPDAELFAAAKDGKLSSEAQVEAAARRMLEDDRSKDTIRLLQKEWLHLERLEVRSTASQKSDEVYPSFNEKTEVALREGLQAYLDHTFWDGDHSLKNFYTSTKGWVNDDSADIYGVGKPGSGNLTEVDLDASKRKGFLTQPQVMSGYGSQVAQSAILRGAFIMESVLCAPSQPPPMNVVREFIEVPDRNAVTLRQVVEMTVEQGTCAGCHKVIDGFGFLFENYDGIGAYQTKERDLDIDASNEVVATLDLNGKYKNGIEFTEALSKSEQAADCAVRQFYTFAVGRPQLENDGCFIAPLADEFIKGGTNMKDLLVNIAKSQAYRYRSAAK